MIGCLKQWADYNQQYMAKEASLEKKIDALTRLVEKGFAAIAEDIVGLKGENADIKRTMATKDDIRHMATKNDILALQAQNNSIESQLRGMKYVKLQDRVADLEEETFGKVRA